jgi:hypothetical protein
VWREAEQASSFGAGLEDEVEIAVLEIAQSAMDEPRRSARGPAREIVLLDERHLQPTQRGIASDATSRDAAADHEQVELLAAQGGQLPLTRRDRIACRGIGVLRQTLFHRVQADVVARSETIDAFDDGDGSRRWSP